MAPLLRLAAALLLTPPASPHSRAPPPEQGQQGVATVDVGNLRYFTWYECCTDTNANLTLGPNLTKNPGSESSPLHQKISPMITTPHCWQTRRAKRAGSVATSRR